MTGLVWPLAEWAANMLRKKDAFLAKQHWTSFFLAIQAIVLRIFGSVSTSTIYKDV